MTKLRKKRMSCSHIQLLKIELILTRKFCTRTFFKESIGDFEMVYFFLFYTLRFMKLTRIWGFNKEAISLRRFPSFSVACNFDAVLCKWLQSSDHGICCSCPFSELFQLACLFIVHVVALYDTVLIFLVYFIPLDSYGVSVFCSCFLCMYYWRRAGSYFCKPQKIG